MIFITFQDENMAGVDDDFFNDDDDMMAGKEYVYCTICSKEDP